MKKVIVASKNPVKINAVKFGFEKMFPEQKFSVEGVSVSSGVSDQPMDDAETQRGALQRAVNAQTEKSTADYWVGMEGGIHNQENDMMAFAWIVVLDKSLKGQARTGAFFLPPQVTALIQQGKELGEADDIVFGHSNSKQQGGAVGLLTNNLIDRTQLYADTVVLALIPFQSPHLYQLDND